MSGVTKTESTTTVTAEEISILKPVSLDDAINVGEIIVSGKTQQF